MKSQSYFVRLFLLASLLFFACSIGAQNIAPLVSNVLATADTANNRIDFTFDLSDTESDPLEVSIRISADSGRTWLVSMDSVTGDTGFPITPGTGKNISWFYDLADLTAAHGSGPMSFRARIIADDRIPIDIQEIVDQVDSLRLETTLRTIEGTRHRTTGAAHLQDIKDTIQNRFSTYGLQDWSHDFTFSGYTATNFVGRIAGTVDEAKTWMTSGHYDSVNIAPGADDNGSATGAVLEAARILSNYHFKNSVRFVTFDLEEVFLFGSSDYVLNHLEPWESIEGLLNMEMIGYYDNAPNTQTIPFGFNFLFPALYATIQADSFRGNFLINVANVASNPLKSAFDSCAAQYVSNLKVLSLATTGTGLSAPDLRRSDHAPFWDAGIQALMLTDGADQRNPFYHTPADSVGNLDMSFYTKSVKAVVATLAKMAQPHHAGVTASNDFELQLPVGISRPQTIESIKIFPNPSDGRVHISWHLNAADNVRLEIKNLIGEHVFTVYQGGLSAGNHMFIWDRQDQNGQQVTSGTYLLIYEGLGERKVKKIVIRD